MPGPQRDLVYLSDMLHNARLAVGVTQRFRLEDVVPDSDAATLLERWIEIVGEAARRVSGDYKTLHPEVPWRQIVAMRHIIAHDYGKINYDTIWRIATIHLPSLITVLEPLVVQALPDPEPE